MQEADKPIILKRQKLGEATLSRFEMDRAQLQLREFREGIFLNLKKNRPGSEDTVRKFQKILHDRNIHVSAAGFTSYFLSETIGRGFMYKELDKKMGNAYRYWTDASLAFIEVTGSVATAEIELFYGTPDEDVAEIAQDFVGEEGTQTEVFFNVQSQIRQLAKVYEQDESKIGIDVIEFQYGQIVNPNTQLGGTLIPRYNWSGCTTGS